MAGARKEFAKAAKSAKDAKEEMKNEKCKMKNEQREDGVAVCLVH